MDNVEEIEARMQELSSPVLNLFEEQLKAVTDPKDALMMCCSVVVYASAVMDLLIQREGRNEVLKDLMSK